MLSKFQQNIPCFCSSTWLEFCVGRCSLKGMKSRKIQALSNVLVVHQLLPLALPMRSKSTMPKVRVSRPRQQPVFGICSRDQLLSYTGLYS